MSKLAKPQMRSDYPKAAQRPAQKQKRVLTGKGAYAILRTWLNKTKGLKTTMSEKINTNKNNGSKPAKKSNGKRNAIIGMLLLLVVMSVSYSSYVVWFGTTGVVPKVLLAPQMIFAAAVLIWKFGTNTK